ncbi:MAG: hypothetical protein ISS48_04325 [Candidatus Aenigmarchaeota archaeon]|nr:hypothetical protein [Candidatus Aenigmarchaeota archaeon]
MLNKKQISILAFLILFLIPCVFSQELKITKTAPDKIELGDILEVKITIKSSTEKGLQIYVKEVVGDVEPIEPEEFQTIPPSPGCKFCVAPPFLYWELELPARETKEIIYKVRPRTIGDYFTSKTSVTTSDGDTFYSESTKTRVLCNMDEVCQTHLNENYFNCPEDCHSGSEDNVCDLIEDNICDPDCVGDADVDCLEKPKRWIYIVIGILVILLILLAVFIISRRRNQSTNLSQQSVY